MPWISAQRIRQSAMQFSASPEQTERTTAGIGQRPERSHLYFGATHLPGHKPPPWLGRTLGPQATKRMKRHRLEGSRAPASIIRSAPSYVSGSPYRNTVLLRYPELPGFADIPNRYSRIVSAKGLFAP